MPDVNLDDFDNPGDDDDFDLAPKARKQAEPPAAEKSVKTASVEPDAAPGQPKRTAKPKPAKKATPAKKVSEQAELMTPSNLQIPASLMDEVKAHRTSEGLTTGQLFIVAIEATYAELKAAFEPKSTGGSLFSSASRTVARPDKGPLTQLNYRMRTSDIAVLDRLVDELGLESRGHLVSEALERYFEQGSK